MPKEPQEVFTGNGNPALNNIALFYYIRDYGFENACESSICYTIATYRNNTTSQCNPSIKSIAHGAGCSARHVKRVLKKLEVSRVIIIINYNSVDGHTSNRYFFTYDMERLEEMFNHDNHEISKTSEHGYVEDAIWHYREG